MNALVARSAMWQIAVVGAEPTAEFSTDRWLHLSVPTAGPPANSSVTATIEVLRTGSGVRPRALVGGSFEPRGSQLQIEIGSTGDLTVGAPRTCRSSLGRPLVTGLPEEFAQATLDGIARVADTLDLPPGIIRIHAGGYDEADSSPLAFERAGGSFGWVIQEMCKPDGLQASSLIELIGAW